MPSLGIAPPKSFPWELNIVVTVFNFRIKRAGGSESTNLSRRQQVGTALNQLIEIMTTFLCFCRVQTVFLRCESFKHAFKSEARFVRL